MVEGCFLDCRLVTRRVLWRLMLGALQYAIYINSLDENVHSMISKFAEDTDIGDIVP